MSVQAHAARLALLPLLLALSRPPAVAAGPTIELPPPIPASVFAARRARAAAALPTATATILHSGPRPRGEHDTDFRVASDFFYLTGLRLPDARLVLLRDTDGTSRSVLVLPRPEPLRTRWEGAAPAISDAARRSFDRVLTSGSAEARRWRRQLDKRLHVTDSVALRRRLAALRLRKDGHEIARIATACEITARSLAETIRSIEPGQRERQLDALLRYGFGWLGAERAAFPAIVGSGPRSCVLHHRPDRRRLRPGELVVLDVGAEFERYAADITRTVPVSGRFTPRQREIYALVLRAQREAIAAVRPGRRLREIDAVAREIIAREAHGYRIPHGVCHWVGLDVHDVGDLDTPLAPGMVLTVEPGIYLDDEALGIRIEDTVLVTADGHRVLSAGVPKRAEAIEALARERGVGNVPFGPLPGECTPRRARF